MLRTLPWAAPARARRMLQPLPFLLVFLLALSALPIAARPASAAVPNSDAADRAVAWLAGQQLADGSFAGFSGTSDPGSTADAMLGIAATGNNPMHLTSAAGFSPVDYLIGVAQTAELNPGQAGKAALALHASGVDPRDAGGVDLIALVSGGFNSTTGWYGESFYGHALAVLALDAAGATVEPGAMQAILAAQTPEGSWGFNGSPDTGTGDSNTTALVVQALVALDDGRAEIDAAIDGGLAYLMSVQADDGSIAYDTFGAPDLAGDANSTALAIQAFVAAGEDPAQLPKGDLLAALAAFQNPSGAFQFQPAFPDDSLLATAQAIAALVLVPFPIPPAPADSPLIAPSQPVQPQADCDFHDPTQHTVCGTFRDYWHSRGGLITFGYALTEEFELFGMRVQYFERARFEYHPQNAGTPYEVLLTRLGANDVTRMHADKTAPVAEQGGGCLYFGETGHNVCGALATFWSTYGSIAIYGFPLTEAFEVDGITVQYFERARVEHQPGAWPERGDVLLGRLGAEVVDRELAR